MKTKAEIKLLQELREKDAWIAITYKGVHDGRRQTVALIKIGDKMAIGVARVSKDDQFNKGIGRVIALGRAYKHYLVERYVGTHPLEKYLHGVE